MQYLMGWQLPYGGLQPIKSSPGEENTMITVQDLMSAIQERMTDQSMSQRDLATKAGISQPHLCNLLNGRIKEPQFTTALRLCNAAGIRVQFVVPKVAK